MRNASPGNTLHDDENQIVPVCIRAARAKSTVVTLSHWFLIGACAVVVMQVVCVGLLLGNKTKSVHVPDSRLVRPIEVP